MARLKKLALFNLDKTQITAAGLEEVAKLTQLALLSLFDTKVTKTGVKQLQNALPKC